MFPNSLGQPLPESGHVSQGKGGHTSGALPSWALSGQFCVHRPQEGPGLPAQMLWERPGLIWPQGSRQISERPMLTWGVGCDGRREDTGWCPS